MYLHIHKSAYRLYAYFSIHDMSINCMSIRSCICVSVCLFVYMSLYPCMFAHTERSTDVRIGRQRSSRMIRYVCLDVCMSVCLTAVCFASIFACFCRAVQEQVQIYMLMVVRLRACHTYILQAHVRFLYCCPC